MCAPPRLSAAFQAFVLTFLTALPRYVNTICGCFPACRRKTNSASALRGILIALRDFAWAPADTVFANHDLDASVSYVTIRDPAGATKS